VELRVQAVFDARRLSDLAAVVARGRTGDGPRTTDLDKITQSIGLVESLTDAELDALALDTAARPADPARAGLATDTQS
jgi:hypothetical protein